MLKNVRKKIKTVKFFEKAFLNSRQVNNVGKKQKILYKELEKKGYKMQKNPNGKNMKMFFFNSIRAIHGCKTVLKFVSKSHEIENNAQNKSNNWKQCSE